MAAEEGGGRTNEEPAAVRLFIGGLKPDVTAEMVEGRFASFGTVESVDLRPAKSSSGMEGCVHCPGLLHCTPFIQSLACLAPWLLLSRPPALPAVTHALTLIFSYFLAL